MSRLLLFLTVSVLAYVWSAQVWGCGRPAPIWLPDIPSVPSSVLKHGSGSWSDNKGRNGRFSSVLYRASGLPIKAKEFPHLVDHQFVYLFRLDGGGLEKLAWDARAILRTNCTSVHSSLGHTCTTSHSWRGCHVSDVSNGSCQHNGQRVQIELDDPSTHATITHKTNADNGNDVILITIQRGDYELTLLENKVKPYVILAPTTDKELYKELEKILDAGPSPNLRSAL